MFIQRDEPKGLDYGGSPELEGIAKALDQARNFREFKNDDLAAYRHLKSALRRHADTASTLDRALAQATLIELSIALDDPEQARLWRVELEAVELTEEERQRVEGELDHATDLKEWRGDE